MDQSTEGTQSAEKSRKVWEFPHSLDVMDPGVDEEQVEVAVADNLESDVEIAVLCVASAYSRPFIPREARAPREGQVERRCFETGGLSAFSGETPRLPVSRGPGRVTNG